MRFKIDRKEPMKMSFLLTKKIFEKYSNNATDDYEHVHLSIWTIKANV